ncbi:Heat shock 70 kDa protein [Wickerhamomyces ciferrii]|uniref:Heat shock 70 kDa protein n=1 Tax=Wickerhamomyces ciferrii (strain ATCC 14091 / BCRC 22168 / CBS 111 / JCM 3599 / NBRC 0793 / NRRL Y-1031 F-60-10) TaxID=1206466 RepID=K0KUF1_WICCF|nr:Heat shock 70 kDa protein [Wickerhamomyces ciferrii]CCH45064.1 Heat shock 70 kDa protein [Wickerhamomyces ciferrii]
MSTPFGLDFGNHNSVVAVAKNRGIDVVVNEVSNRSTPSLIGFGYKNRFIGETGKSQQTSNIKNTVDNLKRIIGLDYNHPDVAKEAEFFSTELVDIDGKVGAKVKFLGKTEEFTSIQLAAMYFNKLKDQVAKESKSKLEDVVVAVPIYYTQQQRHAVADAARVAGLNPVRIVNDITAAAVGYGVFKTDFPEDKALNIAFVDIGHSAYGVSIAALKKGELKILGSGSDKHFGGRDFDFAIANHFADELDAKYKVKVRENPKSFSRILASAERIKKILSANTQAPFSVESVINDIDFSSSLTREKLEELVAPLLERVNVPVETALKNAGLKPEDIDFVEVIGGGSRVPSLKESISEAFGKPLSFHLNQDEAIAKGATFICAIHSPTLRVRPFKFTDVNPDSVSYYWDQQVEDDDDHLEVFPAGSPFPSTKVITLERTGDFKIEAKYTNPSELPAGVATDIAQWEIKGVKPAEGQQTVTVKAKLRNNESGIYSVESAYTVEEIEVDEEIPYEGEGEKPEDYEPKYKKVKQLVKKDDLTIVTHDASLPEKTLNDLLEKEGQLTSQDDLVFKIQNKRNEIEEYIYDFRGKLDDIYEKFVSEQEKSDLSSLLLKAEDWLYDNEDASLGIYTAKYEELASKGNLIKGRYLQAENEKQEAARAKKEAEEYQKFSQKLKEQQPAEEKKEESKDAEGDLDLD